ncbi:MAG: hypothetical protein ABIB98_00140 [bacterium]
MEENETLLPTQSTQTETVPSPVLNEQVSPPPPVPPVPPVEEPLPEMPKKKSKILPLVFIIISLLIIAGGALLFLWQRQKTEVSNTPPVLEVTPVSENISEPIMPEESIPVLEENIKSDAVLIQEALAEKYEKTAEEVKIGVKELVTGYAIGSVSFSGETGGGWWLSAKTGNAWVIVADGNGTVMCADVLPYSFPTSMVPECFDESTGQLTQF